MKTNNKNLINLKDVVKSYKTEAGQITVLKKIALSVEKAEFVGVIGKSGSGKSTLINMVTGIDRPSSGEVWVSDTPIHTLNEGDVAKWRGKNLGIVFQFFQLLPTLSVIENVVLPMDFANVYKKNERYKKAMEYLDLVDVADQANKMPLQLSGGQQQRVAIARALANNPPLMVADEPTGNLDSKTAEMIFNLFERLVKDGKTILMVTHDSDQAVRVGRTIIISDGEIIEEHLKRTFPVLSDKDLIWLTSKMQKETYEPGEIIIKKGEKQSKLYMVRKGTVDIVLDSRGRELVVAEYKKGEYFGEIELLRKDARSIATARACPKCKEVVEVGTIDRDTFLKLLSTSKELQKEFGKTAAMRLKENIQKSKGR